MQGKIFKVNILFCELFVFCFKWSKSLLDILFYLNYKSKWHKIRYIAEYGISPLNNKWLRGQNDFELLK